MKRLSIALSFIICHLSFSIAQTQLSEYRPGMTQEGLVYFLPKTAIRVSVLVEKTTYQPGDFARYAQRYLRLSDVSQQPSTTCRVVGVSQTAVAVADTTKGFAVKFDIRSIAAQAQLSSDGCLLAINTDPVAPVAQPEPFQPAPQRPMLNPRELMGEEILTAGSTAKMAELTAQEIYDLRENRSLLIKGQAEFNPKDGEQLKVMLRELDDQERALSSLFRGVTTIDTTECVIWMTPAAPVNRQVLFRLSQTEGMVDSDDLSGDPFYITVEDLHTVPPVDPILAAQAKKKKVEAGIYVNVPGRMKVTIYQGIEPINTTEHPAPQFGNVELLSGSLFNKRYTTRLWLDPLTGATQRLQADQPK